MPSDDSDGDPSRHSLQSRGRRRLLAAAATGLLGGVAGCADQSNPATDADPSTATDTGTPRPSPVGSPTDTETSGPTTAPTPDRAAPLNGPWPTVHADAANTGTVDASGPQGTPSVRWRTHISLDTGMQATTGPDGPVATQSDGTVVAYDTGGELRWRYQHTDGFVAAPVVADDGTVVVGGRDGTVRLRPRAARMKSRSRAATWRCWTGMSG
jgi:hypothetical protein